LVKFGKLYVQRDGEEEFDLTEYLPTVKFLNLQNSAPAITGSWLSIEGSDGQRLQSTSFAASTVTISLFMRTKNMAEYRIVKNELQRIFYARTLIRLRSSYDPGRVFWVQATPSDITPIEGSSQSLVDLSFTNPSGFSQSLVRSDELPEKLSKLGFGMNIPTNKVLNYHWNQSSLNVFNPSDVGIDPYIQHHDLKIRVKGTGNNFVINNKTNNTSIKVEQALSGSDVFLLDGVLPYLNNNADVATDYGHIELAKGDNDIEITGLNNIDVTFSFPFLYF
jgi:hypothetical protein